MDDVARMAAALAGVRRSAHADAIEDALLAAWHLQRTAD